MRRTLPLVAILLIALLAAPATAPARGGAGHNSATKKLEDAFKIALYVRSVSKNGCYPPAPRLAKKISKTKRGLHIGVANSAGSIHRFGAVFVLRRGTSCNKVMMALRASSGLYILNSASSPTNGPRIQAPTAEVAESASPRFADRRPQSLCAGVRAV